MEKEIAEFIGIMLGDGNIGIYNFISEGKKKKLHQLKVSLDSRNKEYINYVSNLMKEIFEIDPKVYFKKTENAVDIKIYSKEKVLYALNEIGLRQSPKWNSMKIPERYSKGKIALYVLRGLFDTDGSVTIFSNNGILYPRIEIRMCPCPAQEQIFSILDKNGFNFKIQKLERGKIKIRLSGKEQLQKWFNEIGSSNQLYIERAKPFLKKVL